MSALSAWPHFRGPHREEILAALVARHDMESKYSTSEFPFQYSFSLLQDTQAFIGSVYSRMEGSDIRNEISQEKYDMLDLRGNVILPEMWSSLVAPGWTLFISLWSQPTSNVILDS